MNLDISNPMDAPPLRWGILGAGNIARKFTDAVTQYTRSEVVAVASRDGRKSHAFAVEHGIPLSFGGYEALVGDASIDAVYVATPHSLHRDVALLALEAGKPVLVEKPFAHNYTHAQQIASAANSAGVFAMEGMWTRFLPHMVELRRVIAEGQIGEVVHVSADFGHRFDFDPEHRLFNRALAGGGLLDLGVYPVSFIHDVVGPPSSILAMGALAATGVDSHISIAMSHANAAQSTTFTTTRGISRQNATVVGTAGRIDVDGPFWRPSTLSVTRSSGAVVHFEQQVTNGFEYEIAAFARGLRSEVLESETHSLTDTLSVIRTLDEVRRQVGVIYDEDLSDTAQA
ncbi:Gfo/Idh/MocA family protein (plasmid) [Coraliomargarita sp. W4R53]